MKVLFSVWGNPCGWERVTYSYEGKEVEGFTTVEALDRVENFDRIVVFVFDSLIAETPYCKNCEMARARVLPRGYGKLREEVRAFVERWIRNATRLDPSKVIVRVLPNVGYYRDGWTFTINALTPFDLVGSFMLYYLLKDMGEENVFDLSHGINYAPTLLREMALLSTLLKSIETNKTVKGLFVNSEPYARGRTLKIHKVDEVETKPKASAREAFLWIIRYGKAIKGKVSPIKFSSTPPQSLREVNERFSKLGKELLPLAGAFRISAPLALAMLAREVNINLSEIFEELLKFVKISGKKVVWNHVPSLESLVVLSFLLSLNQFIVKAKEGSGECDVNGYGVCLERLVKEVGGLQEDVALHEIDNLRRKDFEEIVGGCKNVDMRNFVAHAGLERNSVKVRRAEGRYELEYDCDEGRLGELLKKVLIAFLS